MSDPGAVTQYFMPEADAQRLTDRIALMAGSIREGMEKLHSLVDEAKRGNAHVALGYRSWTEYLAETLGKQPMRLDRDERREVVGYLAGEGMSTRGIAPIVGASVGTVHGDQVFNSEQVDDNGERTHYENPRWLPPDEPTDSPDVGLSKVDRETGEILDDEPAESLSDWRHRTLRDAEDNGKIVPLTGPGSVSDPAPPKVTGLDGKEYTRPAPKPEPSKPRRAPLPDAFQRATYAVTQKAEALSRLVDDDRFTQNAEKVATASRSDLLRAIDVLQHVAQRLNQSQNPS